MALEERVRHLSIEWKRHTSNSLTGVTFANMLKRLLIDFESEYGLYDSDTSDWMAEDEH
jgi:hypothetical protein